MTWRFEIFLQKHYYVDCREVVVVEDIRMLFREIGKDKMGILITKVMTEKPIFQINDSVQFHRWAIEQKCPCKNRILGDMGHIYFSGTYSQHSRFSRSLRNWVFSTNFS